MMSGIVSPKVIPNEVEAYGQSVEKILCTKPGQIKLYDKEFLSGLLEESNG